MSSVIKAFFGADTSDFEGGAGRVERGLEGIEKQASKTSRQLRGMKHLLEFGGLGLGLNMVKEVMKSLVEFADKDKGALDANTEAVRRFGKDAPAALDSIKAAGVQVLGMLNRIGEQFGEGVSFVMYGAEAVQQFNDIADAADALDKKVSDNADKKAKALGIEISGEWEKKTIKEKVAAIEEAQDKLKKQAAEEHKKAQEEINKLEFEHLSLRDQIIIKQKEYQTAVQAMESANINGTQDEKDKAKLNLLQAMKAVNDLLKDQDAKTAQLAEVKNQYLEKQAHLDDDAKTAAQKANELQIDANTLLARAGELSEDDLDYWKLKMQATDKLLERQKLLNDEADKRKKKEEEITKEIQTQADAQKKVADAAKDYATANRERAELSLDDIAHPKPGQFVSADAQYKAREIQRLEQEARNDEAQSSRKGDAMDQAAADALRRADALRAGLGILKESEKDPLEAQKKAMKTSEEELKKINAKLDALHKELNAS